MCGFVLMVYFFGILLGIYLNNRHKLYDWDISSDSLPPVFIYIFWPIAYPVLVMKTLGYKHRKKGFSLVELMVVIAIIGILASVAIPNFQKFKARAHHYEPYEDVKDDGCRK